MHKESTMSLLVGYLDRLNARPRDSSVWMRQPLAMWLDSMARLELVLLIENELEVDLEPTLLGAAAREMTLIEVAELLSESVSTGEYP